MAQSDVLLEVVMVVSSMASDDKVRKCGVRWIEEEEEEEQGAWRRCRSDTGAEGDGSMTRGETMWRALENFC
jgi:hypothetical protein